MGFVMDINNFGAARASIYDRNSELTNIIYGAPAVPHAPTVRSTYTVPVNKKAIINMISMFMERQSNASSADISDIVYLVTRLAGGVVTIGRLTDVLDANHDIATDSFSLGATLLAGDKIEIVTSDLSTGGGIYFNTLAVITEFDA